MNWGIHGALGELLGASAIDYINGKRGPTKAVGLMSDMEFSKVKGDA